MAALRSYQGTTPQLGANVFVDPSSVVLGDVVLGDEVSVWRMTTIRGALHRIGIVDRLWFSLS